MTNFAIVVVIAAFICATNVHVYADDDNSGGFGGFQSLFGPNWMKPMTIPQLNLTFPPMQFPDPQKIIDLKPEDKNSKVWGTYSSSSSNLEMKDGKVVNQSSASKHIDNQNGNVTEVDSKN